MLTQSDRLTDTILFGKSLRLSELDSDVIPRTTLADTVRKRRQRLANLVNFPVLLWSGCRPSRNFPDNRFPFRASSHFLYFAGLPLENAAIRLEAGRLELFMDDQSPDEALWHGEKPTRDEVGQLIGANVAYPMSELWTRAMGCATIPIQDVIVQQQQSSLFNRWLFSAKYLSWIDWELAHAIVKLRLCHDLDAIAQIRRAIATTVEAHKAGMAVSQGAKTEAEIRAAMERVIMANNMTTAYSSIVTIHGEVLHNEHYSNSVKHGDLLLADVGAETPMGWASDVTRTWPISGRFSPTQRQIYEVVLAAHDAAKTSIRPGVEYKDIHMSAATVLTEGLVNLGILKGDVEELVETDAFAMFFPHGIGHILGLDVHDMEDLGDLAGYELGRTRSSRPCLKYLRLDRPLLAGMVITIEPGFYQVPAILNYPSQRAKYQDVVNWERLEEFADVRGIRIEDDVLVTESGCEVLTAALPTDASSIERMVRG